MSSDEYVDDEFEPVFENKEPNVDGVDNLNSKKNIASSSSSSSLAHPLVESGK